MKRTKIKDVLRSTETDVPVLVKGWVKTFRSNQFIA